MHHCSCDQTWTGGSAAHCARCHTTFSTVPNFDRHIKGTGPTATHHDPAEVGLVLNKRGTWGAPMSDQQRERLDRLAAQEA